MYSEREGICPNCGSPALLVLKNNKQGRHCEKCGAGFYLFNTNYYNYEPALDQNWTNKKSISE